MSIHHVVVAIDGSDASKDATLWAAGLLRDGDDLYIITAGSGKASGQEDTAAHLLHSHADIARKLGVPKARIVTHHLPSLSDSAQPEAAIAEYAAPAKFKLLVVGSRGMGAVQSCAIPLVTKSIGPKPSKVSWGSSGAIMSFVGLGSVSSYLLEHAQLPTAVVRSGTHSNPKSANEVRRICVAVDGSKHAQNALGWALNHVIRVERDVLYLVSVAQRKPDLPVVLCTASPLGYERQMSGRRTAADGASAISHAAGLTALKRGVPSEHIVCMALDPRSSGSSNEGGALVKFTDAMQMDAIVMGHRGLGAALMSTLGGVGSVTHECVQTAGCPVIAIRSGQSTES